MALTLVNLGGIVRLTNRIENDAEVPTTPATSTLTITQSDGTLVTVSSAGLPPASAGVLVHDFTSAQSGLHSVHWGTTGPTTVEHDSFVIEPPGRLLVSVDEAVNHLRSQQVTTSDEDRKQLQWLCLVASEAVEGDLGRTIARRTVTETHTGGGSSLILRQTPVLSITTVTESGTLLAGTDYLLDSSVGILYRGSTTSALSFAWGRQNVVVVYVAGYANPPRAVRMVALTAVQSMWQTSQASFHPALDESAEFAVSSAVAGLPDPLRSAYEGLRAVGVA